MCVAEDFGVYELLHLLQVEAKFLENLAGLVVAVPDDAQHHVVRPYSVAAGAHSLLPRKVQYEVQFLGYSDGHVFAFETAKLR